jgi:hypothetical protein
MGMHEWQDVIQATKEGIWKADGKGRIDEGLMNGRASGARSSEAYRNASQNM